MIDDGDSAPSIGDARGETTGASGDADFGSSSSSSSSSEPEVESELVRGEGGGGRGEGGLKQLRIYTVVIFGLR